MVTIDEAKNLAYTLDRREHTKRCLVQTNPPVQEPAILQKIVQERYDCMSEGVKTFDECNANWHITNCYTPEQVAEAVRQVVNREGETPMQAREFAMDTAGMPREGFQGA